MEAEVKESLRHTGKPVQQIGMLQAQKMTSSQKLRNGTIEKDIQWWTLGSMFMPRNIHGITYVHSLPIHTKTDKNSNNKKTGSLQISGGFHNYNWIYMQAPPHTHMCPEPLKQYILSSYSFPLPHFPEGILCSLNNSDLSRPHTFLEVKTSSWTFTASIPTLLAHFKQMFAQISGFKCKHFIFEFFFTEKSLKII